MATQEELEDAKAFQYKTASIDSMLNDRDGFDPVNDGFSAEIFKYAYITAKHYNEVMVKYNGSPIGIEFKHNKDDIYSMITPDTLQQGCYRTSYFDKNGFSSHAVYNTIKEAVEEMMRDKYCVDSKGILSQLSKSPEFEIGNKVSTLIGKLNAGQITHQQFSDQSQAIYDAVKKEIAMEQATLRVGSKKELLDSLFKPGGTVDIIVRKVVSANKIKINYQNQDYIVTDSANGSALVKETKLDNDRMWYSVSPLGMTEDRKIIDAVLDYAHKAEKTKGMAI